MGALVGEGPPPGRGRCAKEQLKIEDMEERKCFPKIENIVGQRAV